MAGHTPLEACHRGRDLDAAGQDVGQGGEEGEEGQTNGSSSAEEQQAVLAVNGHGLSRSRRGVVAGYPSIHICRR